MIDLHLLGKMLLQPAVLVNPVVQEEDGSLPGDFHRRLALIPVVEPCLGPPTDTGPVGIDADDSRYVEVLYVDVQPGQRVDGTVRR